MFELPKLEYEFDALEPYIDRETMEIHYTKHHKTYLDNFNKAIEGRTEFDNKSIREIVMDVDKLDDDIRSVVRNNGGGYYNHNLFWKMLTPKSKSIITDKFKTILVTTFGSIETFYEKMTETGLSRFGSGWVWLYLTNNRELFIGSTMNQDSPTMQGSVPILGIDLWEHSYYLKYKNARMEYLKSIWNIINWEYIEYRYIKHMDKFSKK